MEIANRELDGVLYLALHLARLGLPTLFGERMVHEYLFRLSPNQPVIYFDQDQNIEVNTRIRQSGGVVFNLSAEGQNLDNNPEVVKLFANISNTFDQVFVRGETQRAAMIRAFPEKARSRVVASGHPAFDLLQNRFLPYYERPEIPAEYGNDYILINTQFGIFNHKMGLDNYIRMVSHLMEWKDLYGDVEYVKSLYVQRDEQERVANKFIELVRRLSREFPDRSIVVRPHPTEGHAFYHDNLFGLGNVHVKHDGAVAPWLASCGALIHYSCTTGVEAFLMGKKVIRFDPFADGGENTMQAQIGMPAFNEDDVVALVGDWVMPEEERRRQMEIIRPYVANCETSAAAVIAQFAARHDQAPTWLPEKLSWWESVKCWRKYVSKLIRMHQPGRNGRKVRYALEKFPRHPVSSIVERVERLCACEPDLPMPQIDELGLNVFLMQPK